MKILHLDIETAPNTAYVWGLWDQNIAHDHLVSTSYIMCWSAKWEGDKTIHYAECRKGPQRDPKGYLAMLKKMHALLDEADAVVHYYGSKFDIPKLFTAFFKAAMLPPSPVKQIDLKKIVAKVFMFESNKLDHVAEQLGFGKKIKTEFDLWVKCMEADPDAWGKMAAYNRHDVVLLEKVYHRLLPWIEKHPSWGALKGGFCCPACGSGRVQSRGTQTAAIATYTRYQCQACGKWFRDNKRVDKGGHRGVNIVS